MMSTTSGSPSFNRPSIKAETIEILIEHALTLEAARLRVFLRRALSSIPSLELHLLRDVAEENDYE